jgi:hypothetical protein
MALPASDPARPSELIASQHVEPDGNQAGNQAAMSEKLDDFSDSFYYRAIRTRIGEVLRTLLVPTEPAPERFLRLLLALDQPKGDRNSGTEEKQGGSKDARASPEEKSARGVIE